MTNTAAVTEGQWGYPNGGRATKAHLFASDKGKSACRRYDAQTVIIFSAETGERHPHTECPTCVERMH